ncbi:MAG: hypothetical protein WD358_08775 [Nitriliruptoraceae bacterium]
MNRPEQWSQRLAGILRTFSPVGRNRAPRVRVELAGRWFPGWMLTVATVVAALGTIALVANDRGQWVLMLVALLFILANPDGMATSVFAVIVGILSLLAYPVAFSGPVHLLVALVPLLFTCASLVGGIPLMARVEVRVLRQPLTRYLVIQAIAQPTAWLGSVVAASAIVIAWMPVAAGAGLAAAGWWFHRQLSSQRHA